MNAVCRMCPLGVLLQAYFPDADENVRREQIRAWMAEKENGRLREIMIENGLSYGAGEKGIGK